MMNVYCALLMTGVRCCSLPLVDWGKSGSPALVSGEKEKVQEPNRLKLSNISIAVTDNDMSRVPRKDALTIDVQGNEGWTNETKPVQSARWDQYHRFPQTIESVPRAIHKIVETSKKLLDPFQISKLIMESIPDAVKEFAWYLVLGLASVWAIFVVTICLFITIKLMKMGCCMMKNSISGIKATTNLMRTSCAGRRRRGNIVHSHIPDNV